MQHNDTQRQSNSHTATAGRRAERVAASARLRSRKGQARGGFVLLMVMILMMVACVLGMAYLAAAATKAITAKDLNDASRAKYLAESGVQHGMCLLKDNPAVLAGSSEENPLGPFHADDSDDSYCFYSVPDPNHMGRFTVTGIGLTRDGEMRNTVSATLSWSGEENFSGGKAMVVSGSPVTIPSGLRINGNIVVKGSVINRGHVDGELRYTGTLTTWGGTTLVPPVKMASASVPSMSWSDYTDYTLFGKDYDGVELYSELFQANDPLANGGAIRQATNPAGVVRHRAPFLKTATLTGGLKFQGTLVVNGNLIIDGGDIELKAQNGFPALVVNGYIVLTDRARVTIDGVVYTTRGIIPLGGTSNSRTTINGALVCPMFGYHETLSGQHVINYRSDKTELFNVNSSTASELNLESWDD